MQLLAKQSIFMYNSEEFYIYADKACCQDPNPLPYLHHQLFKNDDADTVTVYFIKKHNILFAATNQFTA